MSENPFDKYREPSEYLLPNESEAKSIQNIEARIAKVQTKTKVNQLWMAIVIAASILIIMCIGFLFQAKDSVHKLADNYFEVYPNFEYEIVRGKGEENLKKEAYLAYEKGEYKVAKDLFLKINDKTSADLFYEAINLQSIGDWQTSLDILIPLEQTLELQYQDAYYWYLGLAKLKIENFTGAKTEFKRLAKSENDFSAEAKEILNIIQTHSRD